MGNNQVNNSKFCTKCGSPLLPGSSFCTHCGAQLATENAPVNSVVTPPQPKKKLSNNMIIYQIILGQAQNLNLKNLNQELKH